MSRVLRRSKPPLKKPSGSIATLGLEEMKDQVPLQGWAAWRLRGQGLAMCLSPSQGGRHHPKIEGLWLCIWCLQAAESGHSQGGRELGVLQGAPVDRLWWVGGLRRWQGAWSLCPPY